AVQQAIVPTRGRCGQRGDLPVPPGPGNVRRVNIRGSIPLLRAALACVALSLSAALAAAQTPADSRLKRISDTKTVELGYRAAAPPFSFVNPQTREPAGYTIDLCRLAVEWIGKSLNIPVKIEW